MLSELQWADDQLVSLRAQLQTIENQKALESQPGHIRIQYLSNRESEIKQRIKALERYKAKYI